MSERVSEQCLNQLFREARTHTQWLDRPVSDDTLHQLYELLKWGPTSANSCPARILFLRTREAKERLRPALAKGNVDKTMNAPVTAILAYDLDFFEKLPKLAPHNPAFADTFAKDPELAAANAHRNGWLQGAYMIIAARALGLDCGPMSGFDNDKVDREFFGVGEPVDGVFGNGRVRSGFLCNLGYGDHGKLHPRAPRLSFDEACALL